MIDKDGRARLTDFGLAYIVRGKSSIRVSQGPDITGMTTWAAPEILRGGAATKEGDVFTFAMVAIEVCSGVFERGLHAYLSQQDVYRTCPVPYELSGSHIFSHGWKTP